MQKVHQRPQGRESQRETVKWWGCGGAAKSKRGQKNNNTGAHRAYNIPSIDPAVVGELVLQPSILTLPADKSGGEERGEWPGSVQCIQTCNKDKENLPLIALLQNQCTLSI